MPLLSDLMAGTPASRTLEAYDAQLAYLLDAVPEVSARFEGDLYEGRVRAPLYDAIGALKALAERRGDGEDQRRVLAVHASINRSVGVVIGIGGDYRETAGLDGMAYAAANLVGLWFASERYR